MTTLQFSIKLKISARTKRLIADGMTPHFCSPENGSTPEALEPDSRLDPVSDSQRTRQHKKVNFLTRQTMRGHTEDHLLAVFTQPMRRTHFWKSVGWRERSIIQSQLQMEEASCSWRMPV